MTLRQKVLTFIGFCLKEINFKFSYYAMAKAFKEVFKDEYSVNTLRKEGSLLRKEGFLTYKKRYHKKIPALTRKGKLEVSPALPYRKYGPWDGKWRVIIMHIPKKEKKYRLLLQHKLEELGFKKIRTGVYISPHPFLGHLHRLTSDWGIRQHLTFLETEKIEREKAAIATIWNLYQINKEYQDFIKNARQSKKQSFWPLRAKKLEEEFRNIYQKDPHLPSEILPSDWAGDKAYKVYKEIIYSY